MHRFLLLLKVRKSPTFNVAIKVWTVWPNESNTLVISQIQNFIKIFTNDIVVFFCTKKPFFLSIYIQFAFIIHFSLFPTLLVPTLICISAPMLPSSLSATCHQPTDSLQWRTPGRIPEPTPVLASPLPKKTAMNYNIALTLWVARRVPAACRGCSDKSR